jgi:Cys-tRNA(Pro) deacylase
VSFSDHVYDYRDHGGTAWAAEALGLDERAVIKTLVMEDDRRAPLVMLMHGDREVSTRALARAMGVGSVRPCAPDVAERHSGYKIGGTSPFGLRKMLPIYMEATIGALPRVFVNGGKRELSDYIGFLQGGCSKFPLELLRDAGVDMAKPEPVDTALDHFTRLVDELDQLL